MRIIRRSDKGTSEHLLISVQPLGPPKPTLAPTYLKAKHQQRGSHLVIDLIIAEAKRNGWKRNPRKPR